MSIAGLFVLLSLLTRGAVIVDSHSHSHSDKRSLSSGDSDDDLVRSCESDELLASMLASDADFKAGFEIEEEFITQFKGASGTSSNKGSMDNVVNIPVVFHVLYMDSDENISDEQLESNIKVLNQDFRATNKEIDEMSDNIFESRVGDSKIEFYTDSIKRVSFSSCDDMDPKSLSVAEDVYSYLNVWIDPCTGYLGYATFCSDGNLGSSDGVVVATRATGSADDDSSYDLMSSYNLGRTLTHEIGHYFNLYHVWGSSGCDYDDSVDDTPVQSSSNFGCPDDSTNSCSDVDSDTGKDLRDNYENYMDYSDDACMFMFTEDQVTRMRAVLSGNGCRSQMYCNGKEGSDTDCGDDTDDSNDYTCDDNCEIDADWWGDGVWCDCPNCEDEVTCACPDGDCDITCGGYIAGTCGADDSSDDNTCDDNCVIDADWWGDGVWCDCPNCEDEVTCECPDGDCDITCGGYIAGTCDYRSADSSSSSSRSSNSGVNDSLQWWVWLLIVIASVLLLLMVLLYVVHQKYYKASFHVATSQFEDDKAFHLLKDDAIATSTTKA